MGSRADIQEKPWVLDDVIETQAQNSKVQLNGHVLLAILIYSPTFPILFLCLGTPLAIGFRWVGLLETPAGN